MLEKKCFNISSQQKDDSDAAEITSSSRLFQIWAAKKAMLLLTAGTLHLMHEYRPDETGVGEELPKNFQKLCQIPVLSSNEVDLLRYST